MDMCDEEKKAQIEELMVIPPAELDPKIANYEKQLKDAEEYFKAEVEKLKASFERLVEEKDGKIAAVKNGVLGLLHSVNISKAEAASKASSDDECNKNDTPISQEHPTTS